MTLVDECCQADGLQACFIAKVRVIKNGVAFKHSPLFFAQASGTEASPAARAIWSKYMWNATEGGMRLIALKGMTVPLRLLKPHVQEEIHGR